MRDRPMSQHTTHATSPLSAVAHLLAPHRPAVRRCGSGLLLSAGPEEPNTGGGTTHGVVPPLMAPIACLRLLTTHPAWPHRRRRARAVTASPLWGWFVHRPA